MLHLSALILYVSLISVDVCLHPPPLLRHQWVGAWTKPTTRDQTGTTKQYTTGKVIQKWIAIKQNSINVDAACRKADIVTLPMFFNPCVFYLHRFIRCHFISVVFSSGFVKHFVTLVRKVLNKYFIIIIIIVHSSQSRWWWRSKLWLWNPLSSCLMP